VEFETSGIVGDEGAKMHAAGAMSASTAGNLQVTGSIQHNTLSFSLSRGLRSFFFVSRMPNAGNQKRFLFRFVGWIHFLLKFRCSCVGGGCIGCCDIFSLTTPAITLVHFLLDLQ
jgi:hypothetical protein